MSKKFTLSKELGAHKHAHFGVACLFNQQQGIEGEACTFWGGAGTQCHNAGGHDKRKMTVAMLKSVTDTHKHTLTICSTPMHFCSHARLTAQFFYYLNHDSLSKQKVSSSHSSLTSSPTDGSRNSCHTFLHNTQQQPFHTEGLSRPTIPTILHPPPHGPQEFSRCFWHLVKLPSVGRNFLVSFPFYQPVSFSFYLKLCHFHCVSGVNLTFLLAFFQLPYKSATSAYTP